MVGWKMRTSGREVVEVEVEEGAAAAGTTAEKGVGVVEVEVITKVTGVAVDIVTAVVIMTMGMVVAVVGEVADGDHVGKDISAVPYRACAYITRIVFWH